MITPMKKVSLVCLASDKQDTLQKLRDLGVLHVIPETENEHDSLPSATLAVEQAKLALETLHAFEKPFHHTCQQEKHEADHLIETIVDHHERRSHLEEQLNMLRQTRHALAPFGDFSPASIHDLASKGITVKLYETRDLAQLNSPAGVHVHVLSSDKKCAHLAAIGRGDFNLDATPFHLPKQSLSELDAEIREHERAINTINKELHHFTACKHIVEQTLQQRLETQQFAAVNDSMGTQGRIAYLRGFVPADSVDALRNTASRDGWALKIDDPNDDDDVPTLLKLPKWVTPIKAVLQMLAILPGYRESDISGLFLIFFSIFFAILIGDAGYGMLFLLVTIVARIKKPKAPAYPFVLFGILSIGTIIWGGLTGNYFGVQPDALPPVLQEIKLDALTPDVPQLDGLSPEQVAQAKDAYAEAKKSAQDNIITLCFLIGAIHLTIAHIWNTIALLPAVKALAQIGWIGLVWSMYLTALNMVLGQPYPGFFLPLFVTSLVMILLFMTSPKDLKKEWIQHAMFPLSVVNCFVDIVSYIRLFAVGMASLAVAQSFNDMALGIGLSKLWTVPLFAMILLLGHGLNIILCALGILVHGVRLNTLEFSLHKNIEWKGVPYRPFARLSKEIS